MPVPVPVPVLVQAVMHAHKPRDAFIVIGYTMEDICNSRSGFGFLFGEANLDLSVGLFSFARYADDVPRASPRFLRRCGMVLCHEATKNIVLVDRIPVARLCVCPGRVHPLGDRYWQRFSSLRCRRKVLRPRRRSR